ncbi:MAG TPA: bifunctional lysylphosphatidylglycerol flippase/synthetase MprF [Thermodesulfobacteriota bacterium]
MSLAALRARLLPLVGILLFSATLWLLHEALGSVRYEDVVAHLSALPAGAVARAALLTVLGYAVLTGYDVLALRYIGKPIPYRRTAVASFVAYAVGHTLGQSWLTGGSVRYRLYAAWGLSAANVAAVVAFCAFTFWLGFLAVGGVVFLASPPVVPAEVRVAAWTLPALGVAGMILTAAYVALGTVRREPVRLFGLSLAVPPWPLRAGQLAVSVLDWLLAAATLYVLLPAGLPISYPAFVGVYLLGIVAGIASQVPGGLGVLEGVVVLALAGHAPASALLGSLVAFRAIYHLAPLAAAALLLAGYEAARAASRLAGLRRVLARALPHVAPHLLTITTFLGGVVLLVSGAAPADPSRLLRLRNFVPLAVIEASHVVGSLAGAGLLVLARGLQLRLDAAYRLTVVLLAVGAAASLLKGLDYEEAVVLGLVLAALLPSRRYFRREAALLDEAMSPAWIAAIGLALIGATGVGVFAFKHVAYSHGLWWRFALLDDAARSLRASAGAAGLVAALVVCRLLRRVPPEPSPVTPAALERAAAIVAASPRADAWLALLGDKAFLFSDSGRSFLAYGVEGGSFVALGDPVGVEAEGSELVWAFRELADRRGAWPVFYRVGPNRLPLYLDLGLALLKLGEEARVPLEGVSLPGEPGARLRDQVDRLERAGARFAVLPPASVPPHLAELREVSDDWLRFTATREPRFALGFFDERYLARCPVATVRVSGRIVAFANLRLGAGREELAPDLMRRRRDAPAGVMEYLVIELMRWGREQGYRWCNLGMAPLSGLEDRTPAPLWNRVGTSLFQHGEPYDDFKGSRSYRETFAPHWVPRYLAVPSGLSLPRVLADVAAVVTGSRNEI